MADTVDDKIQRLADEYNIEIATTDEVGEKRSDLTTRHPKAEAISAIINDIERITGDDYVITRGPGLRGSGVMPVEELEPSGLMSSLPNTTHRGGNGVV